MERTERENQNDQPKRAKANKSCPPVYIQGNDLPQEERDRLMVALNKELLIKLSHAIDISPVADLKHLGRSYRREARRITAIPDPSYPFSSMHYVSKKNGQEDDDDNMKDCKPIAMTRVKNSSRQFTESYAALASLYGVSLLASREDFLTALLDQTAHMYPEDRKQTFTYINVKDVIKTRGNAITGPKREDIGQYNRKIFENYTKEVNRTMWNQLVVNLKFFPKYWNFVGCDAVIASDFVQVFRFGECYKQRIEECLFLIHQTENNRWCSLVHVDQFILYKLQKPLYECALGKCKRKLNLLHLETFTLYTVEFLCENAALHAFTSLSGEISQGSCMIW